jgi:two-component system LytT family response regulator
MEFDLILMDIELKDQNSFSILEKLSIDTDKVIFVTAFDQYAISAFEISVSDYLLKPFSDSRFNKAIDRFIKRKRSHNEESLSIKDGNKTYYFNSKSILLIKSEQHYLNIIEDHKKTTIRYSISKLSQELPDNFVRINKSTIINLERIKSRKRNKSHIIFVLEDNHIVKSSNIYFKSNV